MFCCRRSQTGAKAADVYKEVLKHGIENDVIAAHETSVINVESAMEKDSAPKIVAKESVLLKVTLYRHLLYISFVRCTL